MGSEEPAGRGGGGGRSGGGAVWTEVRRECRIEAGSPSGGGEGGRSPVQRCEVLRRVLRAGEGGRVEEVRREQETTTEPWGGFWGSGRRGRGWPGADHPAVPRDVAASADRLAQVLEEWAWGVAASTPQEAGSGEGTRGAGRQGGATPEYLRPLWGEGGRERGERSGGGPFSRLFEEREL